MPPSVIFPTQTYALRPIGLVRSCYTGKFGIPRQAGLVTAAAHGWSCSRRLRGPRPLPG